MTDMRNLFIPPLGTTLVLARDWKFDLYGEYRNDALFKALKIKRPTDKNGFYDSDAKTAVILAMGTELIVRRYYIRLGQKAFDSVTFSAKIGKKSHRFWVKLADANRIVLMDEVEELTPDNVVDINDAGDGDLVHQRRGGRTVKVNLEEL